MISGYLFHPRSRIQEVREWILKKWMRLLIPYFSFGLLIAYPLSLFKHLTFGKCY
ncbi:acyltransferase [Bacillus megaterium]|nr:acyltransferase [Priestia megaterium]